MLTLGCVILFVCPGSEDVIFVDGLSVVTEGLHVTFLKYYQLFINLCHLPENVLSDLCVDEPLICRGRHTVIMQYLYLSKSCPLWDSLPLGHSRWKEVTGQVSYIIFPLAADEHTCFKS